jgi:hypothetical protein
MSRPVHVVISKICAHARDDFTPAELSEILECDQWTLVKAIRNGRMEGTSQNYGGGGMYQRYKVEKAQAIVWVWRNTTGNKETLRETLRALAPGMLPFLESLPPHTPAPLRGSTAVAAPRAALSPAKPAPRADAPNPMQPELF